jgi:hypothetical protein
MTRTDALPYVSFVVDDAGAGRELDSDPHAIIRCGIAHGITRSEDGHKTLTGNHCYASILVGWQCGFEPLFVAVHSYLDVEIDEEEAEELARDFLTDRGWFGCNGTHCTDEGCKLLNRAADYVIT